MTSSSSPNNNNNHKNNTTPSLSSSSSSTAPTASWSADWSSKMTPSTTTINARREEAELHLVQYFLHTVLRHGHEILQQRKQQLQQQGKQGMRQGFGRGDANQMLDLTEEEQVIFSRSAYYGWTQGIVAGATTFGILFGGMRWAAVRRGRFSLPVAPPRKSFQELDRGGGGRARAVGSLISTKSTRSNHKVIDPSLVSKTRMMIAQEKSFVEHPSSSPSNAVPDDIMTQVQFIIVGALSLVLGSAVASAFSDQTLFFRHLATVPLLPGKSVYCHRMCPDVILQKQQLLANNSWESLPLASALQQQQQSQPQNALTENSMTLQSASTTKMNPSSDSSVYVSSEYTVADLLNDPETEELESMMHLIHNCERRMSYEKELLRKNRAQDQGHQQLLVLSEKNTTAAAAKEEEVVVTIPPPGVPPQYLVVDVDANAL